MSSVFRRSGGTPPPPLATGVGEGVGVACGSGCVGQVVEAGTGPEFQTDVPFVLTVTPPTLMLTDTKQLPVNGTVKQFAAAAATVPLQVSPPPKALLSAGAHEPDTLCVPAELRLPFSTLKNAPMGSIAVAPSDVTVHSVSQFAELP